MSRGKQLFPFLTYQRYLGITDLDYSETLGKYVITPTWKTYIVQLIALCFIFGSLREIFVHRVWDFLDIESSVGKTFVYLLIIAIPMTELMTNTWLRISQHTQQILYNRLASLTSRLQVDTMAMRRPLWIKSLWIGICLFYLCNILNYMKNSWHLYSHINHLFSYLSLYLLFVRTNYHISCYTFLVYLIRRLLQAQEDQWKEIVIGNRLTESRLKLAAGLRAYDELLLLCQEEIVQVFGVALIFPYMFFVLDAGAICFNATFSERFSTLQVILVISWMTPLILYMTMPLTINEVEKQVSERGCSQAILYENSVWHNPQFPTIFNNVSSYLSLIIFCLIIIELVQCFSKGVLSYY